jgi:hypothetical protein
MKRVFFGALLVLCTSLLAYGEGEPKQNILIRQGFKSRNVYLIVCKGFPKEGAEGISRRETAKAARETKASRRVCG